MKRTTVSIAPSRIGITALILFVLLAFSTQAATSDKYKVQGSVKLSDGTTMMFRLFVPPSYKAGDGKKYPLVLLLHGGGEIGNDNANQLNNGPMGDPWIVDSVQQKWAPFALAPQCPKDHSFAKNGAADLAGIGAVKILDSLKAVYALDTTRFYVGGHSFGGVGTLGVIASFPNKFAAALPCASNPGGPNGTVNTLDATLMAKTPFWAFHGDADMTVNIKDIRKIVTDVEMSHPVIRFYSSARMAKPTGISIDSLKKAITRGAPYLFTEVKDGDHGIGCEEGYRCNLMPGWLFSKAKVNGVITKYPADNSTAIQLPYRMLRTKPSGNRSATLFLSHGQLRLQAADLSSMENRPYSIQGVHQ